MRALVVLLLASCSENPSTVASGSAGSAATERLLAYQPANLPRYQVDVTIETPPGSVVPIDLSRAIALEVTGSPRAVTARIAADDPLAAYDVSDVDAASVLLFPDLPERPVANASSWTVARRITVPGREQPLDLAHVVTYRETSCASGNPTCALLSLQGDARNATVRVDNATWLVVYSFWSKVVLDPQRGIVERAEVHATANLANGPANVTVNATAIATPIGTRD